MFPEGALRAFDTLIQLFYAHSKSHGDIYTTLAPVAIRDAPAFEHRGVMLDISRNWISPQDVIRTIDAMGFEQAYQASFARDGFTIVASGNTEPSDVGLRRGISGRSSLESSRS